MLHGEVKINGSVIGEWTAVRKEQVPDPFHNGHDTWYRYECTLEYYDMGGYRNRAEFDVAHRYGNGGMLLASKVLKVGFSKAKTT